MESFYSIFHVNIECFNVPTHAPSKWILYLYDSFLEYYNGSNSFYGARIYLINLKPFVQTYLCWLGINVCIYYMAIPVSVPINSPKVWSFMIHQQNFQTYARSRFLHQASSITCSLVP